MYLLLGQIPNNSTVKCKYIYSVSSVTKYIRACQAFFIAEGKVFTWNDDGTITIYIVLYCIHFPYIKTGSRISAILDRVFSAKLFNCYIILYPIRTPVKASAVSGRPLSSGVFKFCKITPCFD